jgi:hypothetical protein
LRRGDSLSSESTSKAAGNEDADGGAALAADVEDDLKSKPEARCGSREAALSLGGNFTMLEKSE